MKIKAKSHARNSNIELLRMTAMIIIIAYHFSLSGIFTENNLLYTATEIRNAWDLSVFTASLTLWGGGIR